MSPQQRYQADLARPDFMQDDTQALAVQHLQRLFNDLQKPQPVAPKASFWQKITQQSPPRPQPVQGVYLWGGVGRGKTYLMDTFYDCLPFPNKLRVHFHHFMQQVHQDLTELQGQADPLQAVAAQIAARTRIICFDEFFVSDITDAMILGTLFEYLFAESITLVATSNIPPDDLYRHGLQRSRFLPAIALIKQHCAVFNVDSGVDYRLRTLQQANLYHWPLNAEAEAALAQYFAQLSSGDISWEEEIVINHRPLVTLARSEGVLYIEYEELCCTPRSANDYIELARRYHTVLLANVVSMDAQSSDAARRFIALVDEFYEKRVTLIISAAVPMAELYQGGQLEFEFKRTLSRLIEMQSHEYLAREPLS
ncbi:cell division protein ZapE [Oceanisphaera avium]|uniref:Cell division protein ZapE n=1 Tax=Oceanisphaera avium TaxID=1903694 RepID=A0A1Y0D0Q7_9GAMM|nr:cell division protein ZapE [Oceanisphaera avium]ART80824.1 cell division protein ZapE [Oceanisphaera avium]